MAGTFVFDSGSAPCGGASTVDFDTTGGNLTLPSDTQQLELYVSGAAAYKRGAYDGSLSWVDLPDAGTYLIRELDGVATLGLKGVGGSVSASADAISPRGVKGGR